MSGRALALAVYLLMVGCGRQASPPQTPAVPPTTPRRLTTAGLALNCAHVVIGPDLIRGVLTVRNTSNEPQALVDRWNGWGAYQWTLSVDGISAGNPQVHWYANYYTETVLAPGETRHSAFTLHRRRKTLLPDEAGWEFLLGGPLGVLAIDEKGKPVDFGGSRAFAANQNVVLTLAGSGERSFTFDHASTEPLWAGTVSVKSEGLDSREDLKCLAQGQPLR